MGPALAVNHAALLYFLRLKQHYIQLLSDLFRRGHFFLRPREGGVVTATSHYTIAQHI